MDNIKKLLQQYILENYQSPSTLVVSDPSFFKTQNKPSIKTPSPIKIKTYAPVAAEKKDPVITTFSLPIKKAEIDIPPASIKPQSLKVDFSKIYQKIAPGLKLHKTPPSDHVAKAVKNQWKAVPEVPILVHPSLKMHSELLKALANAIDTKLASSRCCNIEKITFDKIKTKLVIVPKEILSYYKKLSLEETPVLFLENLENYNDPNLKKVLWQQIVKLLQN